MKKLTPKQIEAQIKRNNAKFKKASAAQKRVLIAKDVIERINQRKFKVVSGAFLDPRIGYGNAGDNIRQTQLQSAVLGGSVRCEGCALGGMLVACAVFNNDITVRAAEGIGYGRTLGNYIRNERAVSGGLNKIFSNKQLTMIEQSFEKGGGYFDGRLTNAAKFGRRYKSMRSRLLAIMQNIIGNKGTFKP